MRSSIFPRLKPVKATLSNHVFGINFLQNLSYFQDLYVVILFENIIFNQISSQMISTFCLPLLTVKRIS